MEYNCISKYIYYLSSIYLDICWCSCQGPLAHIKEYRGLYCGNCVVRGSSHVVQWACVQRPCDCPRQQSAAAAARLGPGCNISSCPHTPASTPAISTVSTVIVITVEMSTKFRGSLHKIRRRLLLGFLLVQNLLVFSHLRHYAKQVLKHGELVSPQEIRTLCLSTKLFIDGQI